MAISKYDFGHISLLSLIFIHLYLFYTGVTSEKLLLIPTSLTSKSGLLWYVQAAKKHLCHRVSKPGQLTGASGAKNSNVDVSAQAGAQALNPGEGRRSQALGCSFTLNIYTVLISPTM